MCLCSGLFWPFLFCYFANLTTDHVSAISNAVYDLNWFDYPVKIQKYFILIFVRSQKPIEFTGLKIIPCSLGMFGKV